MSEKTLHTTLETTKPSWKFEKKLILIIRMSWYDKKCRRLQFETSPFLSTNVYFWHFQSKYSVEKEIIKERDWIRIQYKLF